MAYATNDSVKFATFVALRSTLRILGLSSTVLAKVLCRLWGYIREELHLDTAQRFSWKSTNMSAMLKGSPSTLRATQHLDLFEQGKIGRRMFTSSLGF